MNKTTIHRTLTKEGRQYFAVTGCFVSPKFDTRRECAAYVKQMRKADAEAEKRLEALRAADLNAYFGALSVRKPVSDRATTVRRKASENIQ